MLKVARFGFKAREHPKAVKLGVLLNYGLQVCEVAAMMVCEQPSGTNAGGNTIQDMRATFFSVLDRGTHG